MGGKKRILLTASAIILLCLTILVGATLGLFSDGVTVHNHLQAGDLEADLWRTNLEYVDLNQYGQLQKRTVGTDLDLSNTTLAEKNIFGLDSSNMKIAPRSYVKADLEIRNYGNVAFDYNVKLVFTGDTKEADNKAFAEQLLITVTHKGATVYDKIKLSEFTSSGNYYQLFAGELLVDPNASYSAAPFTITVTFKDDNSVNNNAQTGTTTFDLIVEAVQSTKVVE